MTENITNAAYTTLRHMDVALPGATYNQDRNSWAIEVSDAEFSNILTALRSDQARRIGAEMQAESTRKANRKADTRRTAAGNVRSAVNLKW